MYEKMSKSKGNGISVNEVVHGIYRIDSNVEFRHKNNNVINYKRLGVWTKNDKFYVAERFGGEEVFLVYKENK